MSISRPTDGMGVFCTRCNAEMDPDAGFCPNCGEARLLNDTVIVAEEPTRVIEEEIVEDRPARPLIVDEPGFPAWAAALLGVLATLVIVLLIVLFAREDDNEATDTTTTIPAPTVVATQPPPVPSAPSVVTVPVPVVVTNPTTPPTAPPTTATTAP